jgi:tetratricopeptide (TPR) repeat protein
MSVEAAREFYSVWDIDFDATGRQLTLVEFLRPRQLPGRFEVLDGSPLPASEEANLRGPRVAQRLFDKLLIRDDVVAAIQNDPHLTAEIRVAALTAASGLRESADPNALNTASWRIVEVPNQAPDAYRQALRWAEVAAKRQPEWAIINTLGVAQYRMQQFADAIKTLERAAEIGDRGDPHPVDYAALAMAHHRLGHGEEARRHLKQVDDLMKLSKWASDPECLRFQKEVEQLIPRKDASLP